MQTITTELEELLKEKLQAGASGFRGRVEVDNTLLVATNTAAKVWRVEYDGGTLGGLPTDWETLGFDDGGWDTPVSNDLGGFWTPVAPAVNVLPAEVVDGIESAGLVWLVRAPFVLTAPITDATLYIAHDDYVHVYVNGILVYSKTDYANFDNTVPRTISVAPFVVGDNVLAIRVENITFPPETFNHNPTMVEARIVTERVETHLASRISIDKSLRMTADQATVTMANEALPLGWGASSLFPTNSRIRIFQWYGDQANEVRTFTGIVDAVADSRDVLTTVLTCRDMMAILIDQTFGATAPQAVGEAGAVRTQANGVYLAMEASAIVEDILNRAGWPAADRAITPTSYTLDEYVVPDGQSWADAIIGADRLGGLVGYDAWADELGVFHFSPTVTGGSLTDPGTPAYTFRTGEDIISLADALDQYDLRTRVKVRGPMTTTTLTDTWREQWRTSKFAHPVGLWWDPADPKNLRVLDRGTKRLYKLRQSDRKVLSSVYLGGVIPYPLGVSGDPSDSTIYWVLNGPWLWGSGTSSSIKKVRKSDNHVLATYTLNTNHWSAIKVSGSWIYLTNLSTDRVYRRSKVDGSAHDDFRHTYSSTLQSNPSGIMVDGTTVSVFWSNGGTTARFLQCAEAAPGTVTKVVKTAGTKLHGGEMDTATHAHCWGDADDLGLVAKFTLLSSVSQTDEVYAEVIDTALEDELGALARSLPRIHDSHPTDSAHAFEVRRDTVDIAAIVSLAQATETAMRRLDGLAHRRRVLDAGVLGNPALQKTDLVRVEDPVTGIAEEFTIDTYRTEMAGTYLGTLALLPVVPPGDTPADDGEATE